MHVNPLYAFCSQVLIESTTYLYNSKILDTRTKISRVISFLTTLTKCRFSATLLYYIYWCCKIQTTMCQGNNICNNALASIFAESADLQQHNFNLSESEVIYFGHWALGTLGNWLFGLFYYYALVWRENSNNLTKTSKILKYLQKTALESL